MRCIQVLDPFSETQCAAFARRYSARGEMPKTADMLPGHAALDFDDVEVRKLAMAMEKYNEYVLRLVPDDLLLLVDYFSSADNQAARSAQTARDEWTEHTEALIHAFVRDSKLPPPPVPRLLPPPAPRPPPPLAPRSPPPSARRERVA